MWFDECTDPVLTCFVNPEGLSYRNLLVGVVPKTASWLMV
jgi:hypothetical protein